MEMRTVGLRKAIRSRGQREKICWWYCNQGINCFSETLSTCCDWDEREMFTFCSLVNYALFAFVSPKPNYLCQEASLWKSSVGSIQLIMLDIIIPGRRKGNIISAPRMTLTQRCRTCQKNDQTHLKCIWLTGPSSLVNKKLSPKVCFMNKL